MGIVEGGSLLLLLFIAMPLKYLFGMPEAVSVVGAVHGGLFTVYVLMTIYATFAVRWPFRFAIGAIAVAFIPFGNFVLDRRLENWKQLKAA
ncbi:hypothetical protein BB776_01035 [Planococcus salinarum]|uniref:DUF3817 domain-containing protein n=2 Tax=Planococcus salinarum TaxID=622695 RepID=A0ABX3CSW9_9BACL|nr:hypothetical protein BB776_01035 [Planococcus salinarum]TAA72259.1 DUF3817 domain-containing protein [Planococcus salinarum]